MPAPLAARLTAEATRLGARLVLLRHPHGVACPPGRRVYVVDSCPDGERTVTRLVAEDEELLVAPVPEPQQAAPGWDQLDGPLLLVCTHGRHDLCCAVRGRPVALALAERWPARTWECSHIGGDRFAANVVLLPAGDYLGRVEPDQAVARVEELLGGWLPVDVHRGRSSLPLPVQAAQSYVRGATGRRLAADLQLREQVPEGEDVWRVRLAGAAGQPDVEVRVRHSRTGPAELLTCDAQAPRVAASWSCEPA